MIASMDGESWIISTPSKTGSQRLQTALTGDRKSDPRTPFARYTAPRHGGDKEEFPEYDLRLMTCRDPLERWNSLFWYYRTMIAEPVLEEYLHDFSAYLDAVARGESSNKMVMTQAWHLKRWDPHRLLSVKKTDLLWEIIGAPSHWREVYWTRNRHATPKKRPLEETLDEWGPLTDRARQMIEWEGSMLDAYGFHDVPEPDPKGPPQTSLL